MNAVNQKPRLIAIAISHYCEKARWAMDYLEIAYQEEDHAPPFHRQYTARYGGTTVPVLVADKQAFTNSHDILCYLDSISQSKTLYPNDPELRKQVEELEQLFDQKLGVATRTVGYYYALEKPLPVAIAWGLNAPVIEKARTILTFPKIPQLLRQFYKINAENKDAAIEEIREIFALVGQKLATGQKYLVGDSFTAADLTFAALASPILRPPNHPIYSSGLSKPAPEIARTIAELRRTPAGKLALRLYREKRK